MACNANDIRFKHVLRNARRYHPDKDLSTLTLVAVCGTDNPSIINNIPRESFDAQVDAMRRKLGLPVAPSEAERLAESRARYAARAEARAKREAEIVARRAKQDAAARAEQDTTRAAEAEHLLALARPMMAEEQNRLGTIRTLQKYQAEREANDGKVLTFQLHDGCSVAFPKQNLYLYLFRHLTAHSPGTNQQGPTPMCPWTPSVYCPSKTACTACQDWVQELAEGTASVGLPGAGWAHKRDAVLKVAREVRAALPSITFGGVDLHVAGPSKRGPTAPAPRSSKRARKPPKSRDESSSDDDALPSDAALEAMSGQQLKQLMARRGVARAAQDRKEDFIEKLKAHAAGESPD